MKHPRIKIFIHAFILAASLFISLPVQAIELAEAQIENCDDLADLNFDDIPISTESKKNIKLDLAWEYLKLHISSHKKEYLATTAGLATILAITCYAFKEKS